MADSTNDASQIRGGAFLLRTDVAAVTLIHPACAATIRFDDPRDIDFWADIHQCGARLWTAKDHGGPEIARSRPLASGGEDTLGFHSRRLP